MKCKSMHGLWWEYSYSYAYTQHIHARIYIYKVYLWRCHCIKAILILQSARLTQKPVSSGKLCEKWRSIKLSQFRYPPTTPPLTKRYLHLRSWVKTKRKNLLNVKRLIIPFIFYQTQYILLIEEFDISISKRNILIYKTESVLAFESIIWLSSISIFSVYNLWHLIWIHI